MLGEAFVRSHVPIAEGLFTIGKFIPPGPMRLSFSRMDLDEISDRPADVYLSRR